MDNYALDEIGTNESKNVNNIVVQKELMDPLIKRVLKEGTLMAIYRKLNAVFMLAIKNDIQDWKRFSTPNLNAAIESNLYSANRS